jgi:hypothetical protein
MSDRPRRPASDPTDPAVPADAAVIDRLEDGRHAVLLVGPDEIELVLDAGLLPAGAGEGDWLRLGLRVDEALTAQRRAGVSARLEHLRRTRGSGRFE